MLNYTPIKNLNLSKNLYPKPILRYKKNKVLGQLDYSFKTLNIKIENLNNTEAGKSFLYPLKTIQHRHFKDIKIKTFLPFQQLSKSYQVAQNFSDLNKKLANKSNKNYIKILYPVKGGFFAYFSGIIGFLPKSHFKKLLVQSIKFKNLDLSNNLYFSNLHEQNSLLKPNTLFKAGKLTIQPSNIVNNFNKLRSRRNYPSILNFVFISIKNKINITYGKHQKNKTKS